MLFSCSPLGTERIREAFWVPSGFRHKATLWPWAARGLWIPHVKTGAWPTSRLEPICGLIGINVVLPSPNSYHRDIFHSVALDLDCISPSFLVGTKGTRGLLTMDTWPRQRQGATNPRERSHWRKRKDREQADWWQGCWNWPWLSITRAGDLSWSR